MEESVAKLDEMKEVAQLSPMVQQVNKVYEIPMTQIAQKADGSGAIEIAVAQTGWILVEGY